MAKKKKTQDSYPIMGANGKIFNAPVYQDVNGNAYTVDNNGNAYYVASQDTFDEPVQLNDVNVYAPSPQQMLDNQLSSYSTLSSDRTQANNVRHRQYNPHLYDNAQRGAISHNTWTKEHPNLDAWGYVPSAAAFATAAYPLAATAGSAALGTEIGGALGSGVTSLMANPVVNAINTGLGYGFAGKGLYDISQGHFTPMTVLDLAGLYPAVKGTEKILKDPQKQFKEAFKDIYHRKPTKEELRLAEEYPDYADLGSMHDLQHKQQLNDWMSNARIQQLEEDENLRRLEREASNQAATQSTPTPSSSFNANEGLREYEERLNTLQNSMRGGQPQPVIEPPITPSGVEPLGQGNIEPTPVEEVNALNTPPESITIPEEISSQIQHTPTVEPSAAPAAPVINPNKKPIFSDYADPNDYWDALYAYERDNKLPIKYRNLSAGDRRYTREEVEGWFDKNPSADDIETLHDIQYGISELPNGRRVILKAGHTGTHGTQSFYHSGESPVEGLHKAIIASKNPELGSISRSNDFNDYSGIAFGTHYGDTSVDSTPLLYSMMTRAKAQGFVPLPTKRPTVLSNQFGVRSFFPRMTHPMMKRADELFATNPNPKGSYVLDANGDAIGVQLEDANGQFVVPMTPSDEVLERTNRNIRAFNDKYGTSYPEATWSPDIFGNQQPYRLGNVMTLPNILGVFYDQGGHINKKKKKKLMSTL